MAVTNRKLLQLAGSNLANILALSGDNALQARELLVAVDTHQLVLGNGDGTGTIIGSAVVGSDRASATARAGQFYFDTTDNTLYVGTGTEWKPAVDHDLSSVIDRVTDAVENNIATFDDNGGVQDSGFKFSDEDVEITEEAPTAGSDQIFSANKVVSLIDALKNDSGDAYIPKVEGAVASNLPTLADDGTLTDSGLAVNDAPADGADKTKVLYTANKVESLVSDALDDVDENYISKVTDAVENNIVVFDAAGEVQDSGYAVNDLGSDNKALWTAEKIAQAITDAVNGLSWQKPVKSVVSAEPSGTATAGDRYLVLGAGDSNVATGAFAGHENSVAEWDGSKWVFFVPVDGAALFAEDDDKQYAYNGSEWVSMAAALAYSAGNGISITDKTITAVAKTKSGVVVTADGIALDPDGVTIKVNESGKAEVFNLDFGTF